MWAEEDTYPEYYYEDLDYEDTESLSEVRVLRLVKTYHYLVSQRYDNDNPFPYKNFKINSQKRQLRLHGEKYFGQLTYIGDHLEDRDPAYFMAFVFEMWGNRKYYHVYKHLGWGERPGVQLPSMYAIVEYKEELVKLFTDKTNYRPKEFIPEDEHRRRRKEAIENKVQRWCSCFGKTPADYWTTPRHLHPDIISISELDDAESFWSLEEKILREKFGGTAQEIRDDLALLEICYYKERKRLYDKTVARNNKSRAQGHDPQYDHVQSVHDWKVFGEHTLNRIDYTQAALNEGKDVTTEEFERGMENVVNPVDYDHPDTVMYYHYGVGAGPRRKDGSLSG